MPSKTKTGATAQSTAQLKIPAQLLDQLVTGPMTASEVQGLFDQFKKANPGVSENDIKILMLCDEINKVQQIGKPYEVYTKPANQMVADFIGLVNFLPADAAGDRLVIRNAENLSFHNEKGLRRMHRGCTSGEHHPVPGRRHGGRYHAPPLLHG